MEKESYPPAAINTVASRISTSMYHGNCSPNAAWSKIGTTTHFSISHTSAPRNNKFPHRTNFAMSLIRSNSQISNLQMLKFRNYRILSTTPFHACRVISIGLSAVHVSGIFSPRSRSVAVAFGFSSMPR